MTPDELKLLQRLWTITLDLAIDVQTYQALLVGEKKLIAASEFAAMRASRQLKLSAVVDGTISPEAATRLIDHLAQTRH